MLVVFFSEMASQKWIVLFAFLALSTFMVEARTSFYSLVELIQLLNQTINSLDNCSCSGKSPNCSVKVKRKRDEQRFQEVLDKKRAFLNPLIIHTQAGKYQELLSQHLPETQHRITIICRSRI